MPLLHVIILLIILALLAVFVGHLNWMFVLGVCVVALLCMIVLYKN